MYITTTTPVPLPKRFIYSLPHPFRHRYAKLELSVGLGCSSINFYPQPLTSPMPHNMSGISAKSSRIALGYYKIQYRNGKAGTSSPPRLPIYGIGPRKRWAQHPTFQREPTQKDRSRIQTSMARKVEFTKSIAPSVCNNPI